jgi:gas vesicle protein
MYKLFKFLLGLSLGMLAGFVVAMLLAPESGKDTRRQIQMRVDHVVQEGKRARDEQKAKLYAQLEELKKGDAPAS